MVQKLLNIHFLIQFYLQYKLCGTYFCTFAAIFRTEAGT